MTPFDDPPGMWCAHCRALIDASESAIPDAGDWFCTRSCRDLARLGGAEQLGLEGAE